jgi:MFS family permease
MLLSVGFLFVDRIGPAIFALRVLQGVSFSLAFTAASTLAAEFAPLGRRAEALGLFGISTLSTHAIAPSVGEEIVRWGGFAALFTVAASISTLAVVLAASLPGGDPRERAPADTAPWRIDRLQWVLGGTMACCGLAFGAVVTFIPTFVQATGLGRVGVFFGTYTAAAVLTRVVGGGLSDAVGRRAVVLPTLLMLAAAVLLLAFVRSVGMLMTAAALFGLAQGLSYPTLNAFAVDLSAEAHLGRTQALFNGTFNVGVTASAFAFGAVAARFGHRPMFAVAAVPVLIGWALFCFATHRDVGRAGDGRRTGGIDDAG